MRNIFILFIALILAGGIIFPQGIGIISPKPGQTVEPGKQLLIQWNKGNCTAPQVKINIFRNAIAQPNFVLQLAAPNTGMKSWTVPGDFTQGDYVLRIKTAEKGCIGDSGVFMVKKKGADIGIIQVEELFPQNIHVHLPARNNTFYIGETLSVGWTYPAGAHKYVRIVMFPAGQPHLANAGQSTLVTAATLTSNKTHISTISATHRTGKFQVRVQTEDKKYKGYSAPFNIHDRQKSNVQPARAPAPDQPSGASFKLKKLHAGADGQGKMEKCSLVVGYSSKTPFAFSKYKGHPSDGPVYMNCKIILPVWSKDPNYKGPAKSKVIFNHRFSVKFKGKNNLECVPPVLDAGSGEFELIFKPVHSEKVRRLFTRQKMPKSNPWQGHDDWCMRTYPPKMALRLFIHTKEGVKQMYKEFYFYALDSDSYTIPGEINICTGGTVYW